MNMSCHSLILPFCRGILVNVERLYSILSPSTVFFLSKLCYISYYIYNVAGFDK